MEHRDLIKILAEFSVNKLDRKHLQRNAYTRHAELGHAEVSDSHPDKIG